MAERIRKAADLWKHLRPHLARWSKKSGLRRVKSSPPAFTRELEDGHLTLFTQGSSGGVDRHIGGSFTANLQHGEREMAGVHWSDEVELLTQRLPQLFSRDDTSAALVVHNRVVAKRSLPGSKSHYLYEIYDEPRLVEQFLTPLEELGLDYWMAFVDQDDIAAWGAFLTARLDGWIETFLQRARSRQAATD